MTFTFITLHTKGTIYGALHCFPNELPPGRKTPSSNPCTQIIKTREGNVFASKNFPPSFKRKNTKACGSCSLKPLSVAFCFHFWCYYSLQQVSIQSLMFLASHWYIFFIFWCSKLWECAYICGAVLVCFYACFLELRIWMRRP